jgi:hypothetical protein
MYENAMEKDNNLRPQFRDFLAPTSGVGCDLRVAVARSVSGAWERGASQKCWLKGGSLYLA